MTPDSYFIRTGPTTFAPTPHAIGAWSEEDYHFSPVAGLLVHAIEQFRAGDKNVDLQLSRVSFDILGRLPFAEVEIAIEVPRPGRTIELVQATASINGRAVITARSWYLVKMGTADVAGLEIAPLPDPGDCPARDLTEMWGGGYIAQLEARQASELRPGRGATWLTSPNRLVKDEDPIDIAEFCARIDTANGIAPRQRPEQWMFPNVDLTVHLFRRPSGTWTGLDTTVYWGDSGVGVTSSTLHDEDGPVGRAEQSLTIRKM
ncbi:hypothetical protein B841_00725 [Corynebacterium maris DSM 45190]|uniref:Thioesterase n=1 Tax=Corynebacterium maris DSM 45190 TaxID=1224163 RepID=S5TG29_9CORY|nr:thioesterase family protein [Corynebacterium maris]AGS33628.1 hypothetical protein B841_00725 [Corynebacterium maris DSM 45190]